MAWPVAEWLGLSYTGGPRNRFGREGQLTTLTEMVAAVVVHSSAVAFSHFGVVLDSPQLEQRATPASERVVARSHRKAERLSTCPSQQRDPERVHAIKA